MPGRVEYQALLAKVDAFSARVEAQQAEGLNCRPGCDGCCRLERSAWAVELDNIRRWLTLQPPHRRASLASRRDQPEVRGGERCVFLDDDGQCAIYPVRPIICRTHGPVARMPDGGLAWCELNFPGLPPEVVAERVPAGAVLDIDLLNRMLALVNARFVAHAGGPDRAPLAEALDPAPTSET